MAYLTVTELKAALADAGGAGSRTAAALPDGRLQANIDEAVAEVTGRLVGDFVLPAPGPDPAVVPEGIPSLMRTILVGIAGYLATLEYFGSQPVEERDPVVLRYTRARELLAAVALGRLTVEGIVARNGETLTGEPAIFQGGPDVGLADGYAADQRASAFAPGAYFGGQTWG